MNISTETREILRNYRAVINARRREMGQKPLTTAQIVDEICDFVANQQAVFLGGQYILQGSRHRWYRVGGGGRLSARAKTPGLQRPERSRRLCRTVACAPGIPAKGRRDVRGNAVSRTRSPSLQRVPAHCLPGATHPYESLSPGAHIATTCRTDCPG